VEVRFWCLDGQFATTLKHSDLLIYFLMTVNGVDAGETNHIFLSDVIACIFLLASSTVHLLP
jgi:hypothetical protein